MPSVEQLQEVQGDEVTVSVSKTYLGNTKTSQEKINIRPFVTQTARVGVKLGRLKSLGNYENVKFEVFISSPAYVEEIVDVYKQVKDMAINLIDAEMAELDAQLKD